MPRTKCQSTTVFGAWLSKEPVRKPAECDVLGISKGEREIKDLKLMKQIQGAQIRNPK